jgi:hypothetical protein
MKLLNILTSLPLSASNFRELETSAIACSVIPPRNECSWVLCGRRYGGAGALQPLAVIQW